ncbi:hypothetical protein JCM11251_003877 [Rhodosporidiobolus azoricus]
MSGSQPKSSSTARPPVSSAGFVRVPPAPSLFPHAQQALHKAVIMVSGFLLNAFTSPAEYQLLPDHDKEPSRAAESHEKIPVAVTVLVRPYLLQPSIDPPVLLPSRHGFLADIADR